MLPVLIQFFMLVSFVALSVLVWRVSKRPSWRIRSVIYGWGLFVAWSLIWSFLLPMCLRGVLDSHTLNDTFPEGTLVMGTLFGGWFWPLILVELSNYGDRKKKVDDRVT